MQMLTFKKPGVIFFRQHVKVSSCSQIYSDSFLMVFQIKGCLVELSPNTKCRQSGAWQEQYLLGLPKP